MINKQSKLLPLTFFTLFAVAVFLGGSHVSLAATESTETDDATYPVSLTKKFSDVYPQGYTADQFKFQVEGTSDAGTSINETVTLNEFTADTADATVQLPIGTYTVTEIGPDSFVPGEWTVQWSGFGCANANSPTLFTTMTVSDDSTANICRADNQWRHGKLTVEKIVVGTSTSPENFDFTVTQGSTVRHDGPFDADGINSNLVVAIGDYAVVEASNPTYTTSYSEDCTGVMEQGSNAICTITNTYNEDPGGGGDDGNNDDTTGVLVVQKVIVGTSTVPVTDFSFSYTGVTGSTTFDASGSNQLSVATGTYTITETPAPGYTTTYDNCTAVVVAVNATSTCTITNTLDTTTGGGGGDPDDEGDDYRLQGYVWHDENEDGVWDENEDPLQNWTVYLTGSSTSASTVTDANGYYFFLVEEGTWTLSEIVQTDWEQTFPQPITHEVTVPEVETEQVTLRFPLNLFLSIAHAETITVDQDFNFGNVFKGGSSGGSGGGGGGSATRTDRNSTGGGTNDTPDPTPIVLGEQVSPVPLGAANAGAGGTAVPHSTPVAFYLFVLTIIAGSFGLVTKYSRSK